MQVLTVPHTKPIYLYTGHAATKPDKVNILLCDINERLMWLKLTNLTNDNNTLIITAVTIIIHKFT